MKKKLSEKEFNERCYEVFFPYDGDEYYYVKEVFPDGTLSIAMSELNENGDRSFFFYEANMGERPEALAYLLGQRNDFND